MLPGFALSLGFTLTYLSLLVLVPLAACFLKAATLAAAQFWAAVWTDRARAAYLLTFGASLVAAGVNAAVGFLLAWVLTRYDFPLRKLARRPDRSAVRPADGGRGPRLRQRCMRRTAGSGSSSCRWESRERTRGSASCWC